MNKFTVYFQSTLFKDGQVYFFKFKLCCAYKNVIALRISWYVFHHHITEKIILVLQNYLKIMYYQLCMHICR